MEEQAVPTLDLEELQRLWDNRDKGLWSTQVETNQRLLYSVPALLALARSASEAKLSGTHYQSNGEAGDGWAVCVVCGNDTDTGHTHAECFATGESAGHFDGYHQALEHVAKATLGQYEGENLDELTGKLKSASEAKARLARLSDELAALRSLADELASYCEDSGWAALAREIRLRKRWAAGKAGE